MSVMVWCPLLRQQDIKEQIWTIYQRNAKPISKTHLLPLSFSQMENTEMWNKCPGDNKKNSKIQNLI